MRKTASLVAAALLAAAGASPAWSHMGIDLRTYPDGAGSVGSVRSALDPADALPANGNLQGLVAGPPVSPKQSCAGCHDYDTITSAYHFQLGADERVDADGDGNSDDLGQILAGPEGILHTLPTLYNINSPGQFGAW